MEYFFEWDPKKARENIQKHKVNFQRAATIFRDPSMISVFDDEHSDTEERWITAGMDEKGAVQIVSHTFETIDKFQCSIRIISAPKTAKDEIKQYKVFNP
ncbi:MAG: BrnT family toxin [Desulfobacterales bacterium]